jgi:hypothetical protein
LISKKGGVAMQHKKRVFTAVLSIFLLWGLLPPAAYGKHDACVVYAGKNKKDKKQIMRALSKSGLTAKAYNSDLLTIADYSGKQKAITKISQSNIVVIIKDSSMEALSGTRFSHYVMVVNSVKTNIKSSEGKLYVLNKGTGISGLGNNVKKIEITSAGDLPNSEKIKSLDVVLVNQNINDFVF